MIPKLSICIPTYNFGAFIGETLKSIVNQAPAGLEIVVVDGASTDDTRQVVSDWQKKFPSIRYFCLDRRGGIDRDMAKSVELANGEYCWLFSSDDIMKPGALELILGEIKSGLDVYLAGITLCDLSMRPIVDHKISRLTAPASFDLADREQRLEYFNLAETTTALFSFMGSIIIKRARWNEVPINEEFVGSCWAHVARIFSLIPTGLTVRYLAKSLLDKRGENDSFMDKGIVHRFGIAVDGYHRLGATFFGPVSPEAFHIRRVVRNEFSPRVLLHFKMESIRTHRYEDLSLLKKLVDKLYDDPSFVNRLYVLGFRFTPVSLYHPLRGVYRLLKHFARRIQ